MNMVTFQLVDAYAVSVPQQVLLSGHGANSHCRLENRQR